MNFSYYPGCTLKNKAQDLDRYARLSAEKLGIQSGDRVRITTPSGSIGATANVTATVFPGVVHMYHGNEKANTSYLMNHDFLDPLSGYPGYKSFPCRVEKEV